MYDSRRPASLLPHKEIHTDSDKAFDDADSHGNSNVGNRVTLMTPTKPYGMLRETLLLWIV
jgi:hypothetical protein